MMRGFPELMADLLDFVTQNCPTIRVQKTTKADFDDGTHVFIDADSGALLAVRTAQWRWFDFMWGLHIMDLQTREDTHHPILIVMAAFAGIGTILGLVLLPLASRRTQKGKTP